MGKTRKSYESAFKLETVLEAMQKDKTIEQVAVRRGVSSGMINNWKKQFRQNAHIAFETPLRKSKRKPEESPEYLKKIIGDQTIEIDILKKALSVWD